MARKRTRTAFGLGLVLSLSLVGSSVFVTRPARADSAEAEQLFRAARAAFERREFRGAAATFEEAYRHSQHGSVLYNAGVAWQIAGEEARGADAFARALARGDLDPDAKRDAERRLSELSAHVGRVEITGSPPLTISLAHVRDAHPPITIYVSPGRHELVVVPSSDTAPQSRTIDAAAGGTVTVDLPPPPKPTPPIKVPPPPPPSSPSPARWIVSGSLVGTSAVSAVVGGILGLSALSARDDFNDSQFTDASLREKTVDLKTAANVLWATAIVTGVAGVVVFLVWPSESTSVGRNGRGLFVF